MIPNRQLNVFLVTAFFFYFLRFNNKEKSKAAGSVPVALCRNLVRGIRVLIQRCHCWSAAVGKVHALFVVEGDLVPSSLGIHLIGFRFFTVWKPRRLVTGN